MRILILYFSACLWWISIINNTILECHNFLAVTDFEITANLLAATIIATLRGVRTRTAQGRRKEAVFRQSQIARLRRICCQPPIMAIFQGGAAALSQGGRKYAVFWCQNT